MAALSEERKAAMAAGRAVHLEAEREASRKSWEAYRAWLKRDARLHAELVAARERGTPDDVAKAYRAFQANLRDIVVPRGAPPPSEAR